MTTTALPIVLLGPQRLRPTLIQAVTRLGLDGPIATITAGWQEREDDDDDLREHLGGRRVPLKLYARVEELFRQDPELAAAHRKRQERLRAMQDLYRVRLEYSLDAFRAINRRAADADLLDEERRLSIEAVRVVDETHLARSRTLHEEFDARWRPNERDAVARAREDLAATLADCAGVGIAGGHVAVLRNRLELLDVADLFRRAAKPIFAWAAGAMALTERVVLFHDSPPQGPGNAELLAPGLGMVRGIVALPDPRLRLRLDDTERVALLASRFDPAECVAMDHGAHLYYDGARFTSATGTLRLMKSGATTAEWTS